MCCWIISPFMIFAVLHLLKTMSTIPTTNTPLDSTIFSVTNLFLTNVHIRSRPSQSHRSIFLFFRRCAWVWLGLLSNWVLNFELKTALYAGLFVFALSLRQYCKASFLRLRASGGSVAWTHKLTAGEVLNAPKLKRKAWLWMGSRILRYEGLAEPYTMQP